LGLPVRRSELIAEARLTQSLRPSDSSSVESFRGKEVVRDQIGSAKAYFGDISTVLLGPRTLTGLKTYYYCRAFRVQQPEHRASRVVASRPASEIREKWRRTPKGRRDRAGAERRMENYSHKV
jgi:hypothetical protein